MRAVERVEYEQYSTLSFFQYPVATVLLETGPVIVTYLPMMLWF
jgi:hypothetical protein